MGWIVNVAPFTIDIRADLCEGRRQTSTNYVTEHIYRTCQLKPVQLHDKIPRHSSSSVHQNFIETLVTFMVVCVNCSATYRRASASRRARAPGERRYSPAHRRRGNSAWRHHTAATRWCSRRRRRRTRATRRSGRRTGTTLANKRKSIGVTTAVWWRWCFFDRRHTT